MELQQITIKDLMTGSMITLLVLMAMGELAFYGIALIFKDREQINQIRKLYRIMYYTLIVLTFIMVIYE